MTFHIHQDEVVLPERLAKSGGPDRVIIDHREKIYVHVSQPGGVARYEIKAAGASVAKSLDEFNAMLAESAAARTGAGISVRVSYDSETEFGLVMPVFNTCKKLGVAECGLIPTRAN